MFRRSSVNVTTNDGTSAATGGGVFTRVQSFTELFDGHELANWQARFEGEKISPELAMTMSKAELRSLLPDEPMGHVLLVKQLLDGARVMDLPTDAFTTAPARWIAAVSLKPEPAYTLIVWFEVCVVMSALFMTMAFSAVFSVPQSCAFEAAGTPSQYCEYLPVKYSARQITVVD